MTGRPALAAVAAVLVFLPLAAAQMVSPLQGQGRPNNSTRDVFFSMHLDRLLDGEPAMLDSATQSLPVGPAIRLACWPQLAEVPC